jgi:hypothetical protein
VRAHLLKHSEAFFLRYAVLLAGGGGGARGRLQLYRNRADAEPYRTLALDAQTVANALTLESEAVQFAFTVGGFVLVAADGRDRHEWVTALSALSSGVEPPAFPSVASVAARLAAAGSDAFAGEPQDSKRFQVVVDPSSHAPEVRLVFVSAPRRRRAEIREEFNNTVLPLLRSQRLHPGCQREGWLRFFRGLKMRNDADALLRYAVLLVGGRLELFARRLAREPDLVLDMRRVEVAYSPAAPTEIVLTLQGAFGMLGMATRPAPLPPPPPVNEGFPQAAIAPPPPPPALRLADRVETNVVTLDAPTAPEAEEWAMLLSAAALAGPPPP